MMKLSRTFQAIAGGFMLAVLWFDLKFDMLVYEHMAHGVAVDSEALASIKAYYLQALSMERGGFPLIASMMLLCVAATLFESISGKHIATWRRLAAPLLVIPPILLAGIRVLPNAKALAQGAVSHADQVVLSTAILQDHLFCFASMTGFLLLRLTWPEDARVGRHAAPNAS